tara:strand:- start:1892 stop:2077 length:186 start_codon:yes stop_codon:yes gene_type:complete
MEFRRKTSRGLQGSLIRLLVKSILAVFVIAILIIILNKIELPAPTKNLIEKISNDKLKIVK